MPAADARRETWLDVLKVTATFFVVFWHLHPLPAWGDATLPRAVRFFEFEISLTAVPTFLLVSLYLFFARGGDAPGKLASRLSRVGGIYLFWTAVQIAVAVLAGSAGRPAWKWLMSGGPALPHVYHSIFYFLFALLALTVLGWCYSRLGRARAAVGWFLVIASAAYFEWALLSRVGIPYYRLDNFLLYVPVAHALATRPASLIRARWAFAAAWLGFAVHDLALARPGENLGYVCVYGRLSVVCGALALCTFAASIQWRPRPLVTVISRYSLGIYA